MAADKSDVLHGTLDLIVLKTLDAIGPLHGYAIARRIEQISSDQLAINQGTLYPALLKLQQRGWISTKWGESSTGRRAGHGVASLLFGLTPRDSLTLLTACLLLAVIAAVASFLPAQGVSRLNPLTALRQE